ncbi:MAG: antibiotic biosynthesis monooxygenase [Pseudomonadota bacterium]
MGAKRDRLDGQELLLGAGGQSWDCCDPSGMQGYIDRCCAPGNDGAKELSGDQQASGCQNAVFIAMDRFLVKRGAEDVFEAHWRERDVEAAKATGFLEFRLLRGPEHQGHTVYAAHTVWASHEDFLAWTSSRAFRDGRRSALNMETLVAHEPAFEGFATVKAVLP